MVGHGPPALMPHFSASAPATPAVALRIAIRTSNVSAFRGREPDDRRWYSQIPWTQS